MDRNIQLIYEKINKYKSKKFYIDFSKIIKNKIGFKLLTLTVIDNTLSYVERVYTTNYKIYPLLGIKPIPNNDWKNIVIRKKKNYFLKTQKEIKKIFFDYDIIFSLGCGSIINYLVMFEGHHLGTINILHKENYYTTKHINNLKKYSNLLIPFFLKHQQQMKKNKYE